MKKIFQLRIRSLNNKILGLYKNFLRILLQKLNIKHKIISLPTKIRRITLLKSPHVYKKAREQFQIATYTQSYYIESNIKSNFVKYILLNKPSIIKIKFIRRIV